MSGPEDDWKTGVQRVYTFNQDSRINDEAIEHINSYGSHHTDAIITENDLKKKKFTDLIDSSSVMLNASTRFADGFR
ncbi:MAG: hypothetical protein R2741_15230 [Methanolobus sp.]